MPAGFRGGMMAGRDRAGVPGLAALAGKMVIPVLSHNRPFLIAVNVLNTFNTFVLH